MPQNYFDIPHREGFFELDDYDLFYRAFGAGDTVLLTLHGGPGGSSDLLAPLAQLGGDDLTVYLYDQFGSGQSDTPAAGDFDRYTVAHYREEVEAVRAELGAESVVLLGTSWGGMVAQEYVLQYPENVSKLILSSTLHDIADTIERLQAVRRDELTADELETVRELESNRAFDDPAYRTLMDKVYSERLLRIEMPIWWEKAEINIDAHGLMWGPNEYAVAETARLRDWSVKERLAEIETPTLVITGNTTKSGRTFRGISPSDCPTPNWKSSTMPVMHPSGNNQTNTVRSSKPSWRSNRILCVPPVSPVRSDRRLDWSVGEIDY